MSWLKIIKEFSVKRITELIRTAEDRVKWVMMIALKNLNAKYVVINNKTFYFASTLILCSVILF